MDIPEIYTKEDIKQIVREMIEDGEIEAVVEVSRIDNDAFGNQSGAVEEVEVYLQVSENK